MFSRQLLLAALLGSFVLSAAAQSYVNFEGKQTAPARLSPSGNRLFVVNTPDNRLSVFDVSNPQNPILMAEIPVGIEPVSVNAVSDDEAWVVNEVSDSVSVVSVSKHIVTDTLQVKDEPADIVFANGRAFVTAARNNQIAIFDSSTRASITNVAVLGENPRSLCVNAAGTKVYAAFALSGNRTTLIPFDRAPPQPPPTNPNLPPPPRASLIVDATDPAWSSVIRYTMPDNDVVELDTTSLGVTRYFSRVGTVNFAVAARPGSGDLYVANTDARNLTRFEPALRSAFVTNQLSRVDINSAQVTRHDLNPGFNYTNFPSLPDKTNALAQPAALVFETNGSRVYVAAFGSDRVALIDANTGAVLSRIELNPDAIGSAANPRTMRGPRGLALKDGAALYVANRISNTLTVINPVNGSIIREIPIGSHDPTPAVVRQGRGFLYDARLSGNGTVSCASCHIDGEMDMLAWDLGNPGGQMETNSAIISGSRLFFPGGLSSNFVSHPMKGPMTTQTLRGLNGLDPLHWRGDRTNFTHFNGAFDSLLGGPELSSTDMTAYRAFINTMVFQPNPHQNLDRTLPASISGGDPNAGRSLYLNTNYQGSGATGLKCNTCHTVPTGSDRSITPANLLQEPQSFKVPHLRNVYQKLRFTNTVGGFALQGFGLVHDGMDPTLFGFFSRPVFGAFANNTAIKQNISAFVQCFDTGTAPAVGHGRTITSNNVNVASTSNTWSILEAQAAAGGTNIELVVKGTIAGALRGLLYRPAQNNYTSDQTGVGPFTRAQLRTFAEAGDSFTIIGVPPGSGRRIGIERRQNGQLDGDIPAPSLRIAHTGTNAMVFWSTNGGFVLQAAPTLPAANWSVETSERRTTGTNYAITNVPAADRFYRLKEL